VQGVLYM